MEVYTLLPAVKHYHWGSKTFIPHLLGISNPKGLPYAELWMGSHPDGMSLVDTGGMPEPLDSVIQKEREAWLGRNHIHEGVRFLFKVIAVDSPLSIQCHPDLNQAREGFAREERQGIPRHDEKRTYKDPSHKPELLYALTEYTALCGFRPLDEVKQLFAPVNTCEFDQISDLRAFFHTLYALDERQIHGMARQLKDEPGEAYELHRRLYDAYGADAGIFAPLLLRMITLSPGEAVYIPPGVLHAYIQGAGLELMASSDNVLRGGLTNKYVDREELARIAVFSPADVPRVHAVKQEGEHGPWSYPAGGDDFLLELAEAGSCRREGRDMLEIGIVLSGAVEITYAEGNTYTAEAGGVFVLPAAVSSYTLHCTGKVSIARRGGND